ncbi:transketolase [uncultured Holdemanella sp.]|uniref:transketolase n=1 Tax=uncultured Holdemanella sp. TaxID=1763549 RepID=UPI0025871FD5|nr:transketolase [uncultured Holdemanella sp.]
MTNEELKVHAKNIRRNIVTEVYSAKSGHPGGSLSATDILTELYFEQMDINKENVESIDRDRFVLSKGHASPLLYATLAEKGFIDLEDLKGFRHIDSKLQGHPNMNYVKGVDMSTGSLGQGISCAVGMAITNKVDGNNHRIYVLLGDGECEEGEVWEAAMAASHYKLDNLCAILDYNHLQIDGNIKKVIGPEPFMSKFEAFGWEVLDVNGHDFDELRNAFNQAKLEKGKPTMIIAHTIKGKGVSFMENNYAWHGAAPNQEQYEQAMEELGGLE